MADVLNRIDNTLADLCPCGDQPRPGSAYCSYDCEPTWRGQHTTTSDTAMRWRPDLVTEDDNTVREPVDEFRRGPHQARVFTNPTGGVHCRLDDGNRYVGLDVDEHQAHLSLEPVWERLERELGDPRLSLPGDPWDDVMSSPQRMTEMTAGIIDAMLNRAMQDWPPADLGSAYIAPFPLEVEQPHRLRGVGETLTNWLDNSTGRFEPDQVDLPGGPLLDGLVGAEAEAQLRARAREIGEAVNPAPASDLLDLTTRYLMAYMATPVPDFRGAIRIISTA